jgi:sulfur relay protein TusB/DsrH
MVLTIFLCTSPYAFQNAHTAMRLLEAAVEKGQDGVLLAMARQAMESIPALASEIDLYALEEDLRMRGFGRQEVLPQVQLIDYDRLVDLMVDHRTMGAF